MATFNDERGSSPVIFVVAYVLFAFTIGSAWFIMAPIVPELIGHLHSSLSSVLMFLSLYGFAMIVFSMPAAWWARKDGIAPVLRAAIVLSFVGLGGRIFAPSYSWYLVAQAIAAIAYPLLISPVGAVVRQAHMTHVKTVTGLTIGMLFFGMAAGAYMGPTLHALFGYTGVLVVVWLVNAIVGLFLFVSLNHLPRFEEPASEPMRIVFGSPRWWFVGLAIAATSVMFGGIAVSALLHLHVANAPRLGATLTALTFLGSGIGAILFPMLADFMGRSGVWQVVLIALTTLLTLLVVLEFTGVWVVSVAAIQLIFLLLGVFGNGCYALSLSATAEAARETRGAGVQTAGFSMASNVGVAILPPLLGPLVIVMPAIFGIVTVAILGIAVANVIVNVRHS